MNLLWSEKHDNHTYIYFMGKIIYKRWDDNPNHPSVLFNEHWPNVWINKKQLNQERKGK